MKTNKEVTYLPQIELKFKKGSIEKIIIRSSKDIFELSKKLFNLDTIEINEEVLIIFLNRKNATIGWMRHTTGGTISSIIDIKLILSTALSCIAQGIIMLHNHPSSNIIPSSSDSSIVKKLCDACKILDITFLDSIIVGAELNGYYSFADEGQL